MHGREVAAEGGERLDSGGSIFVRFLRFGALAWGGPAAQIAMIKRECVDELDWISEASFKKTLAVYQILPGPEAHELCVYFGRIRGGKLGGFLAGLGFALPGFLLMLALSILYVRGQPGRAPGRDLLRAERGGWGDHRPGPGQAEPQLPQRRAADRDRGGGLRLDGWTRGQLRRSSCSAPDSSTSSGPTPTAGFIAPGRLPSRPRQSPP